jgi:phosphoribosylcarboxyaminoimidazole (NCAIR) mutase
MAKVAIEFDTVEKTMSATIDGSAVPNVVGVNLYKSYSSKKDEYSCEIVSAVESEDDDMRAYTRICAAEGAKARELAHAGATPAADFPGFVAVAVEDPAAAAAVLKDELLKFFGKGGK